MSRDAWAGVSGAGQGVLSRVCSAPRGGGAEFAAQMLRTPTRASGTFHLLPQLLWAHSFK